mmetsp:Transcript_83568/g.132078  ORF Transcript_83568/g.132078 Transcript_83568/m.132078 type:complete len:245 (+) Transcript_83568:251-985(+)
MEMPREALRNLGYAASHLVALQQSAPGRHPGHNVKQSCARKLQHMSFRHRRRPPPHRPNPAPRCKILVRRGSVFLLLHHLLVPWRSTPHHLHESLLLLLLREEFLRAAATRHPLHRRREHAARMLEGRHRTPRCSTDLTAARHQAWDAVVVQSSARWGSLQSYCLIDQIQSSARQTRTRRLSCLGSTPHWRNCPLFLCAARPQGCRSKEKSSAENHFHHDVRHCQSRRDKCLSLEVMPAAEHRF